MRNIDPKQKFVLFKQTKHFCSVPWHLLTVMPNGDVVTCTSSAKRLLGNIVENSIEEILDNQLRKKIKKEFLIDSIPAGCESCIAYENEGNGNPYGHVRYEYNRLFLKHDNDYFDTDSFQLGALDLHWSSICDLKCITCRPEQSSSISIEQNKKILHTPTDKAVKFIDWIVENQSTLTEVYLSGGEPTLIKYNLKLLEKLEKRPSLRIRVNSNLMWDHNNLIVQEILKFPNVLFTCSVDDLNERFEYTRRGANWNKFLENIQFLKQYKNVTIRINSVFTVLNCKTITSVIDYFYNLGLTDFTINQCGMGHTYLRPRNAPSTVKNTCREQIIKSIDSYNADLNLVGQLKNCLMELENSKTEDYAQYLDNIDKLTKTNWTTIFRELV